jgi:hypothetical protein
MVRTILWDQQRGSEYWLAAAQFAAWIRNRMARTKEKTAVPEQLFTSTQKLSLAMARVPLATCFSYVEKHLRDDVKTLAAQRKQMVFVGYATDSGCYRVYDPEGASNMPLNRRYADVHFVSEPTKAPQGQPAEVEMCDAFEAALELEIETATKERAKCVLGKRVAEPCFGDPLPRAVNGVTYIALSKNRTVSEIARMFNVPPTTYLKLLDEHKDPQQNLWFNSISKITDVILKGSDVPFQTSQSIPQKTTVPSAPETQSESTSQRNPMKPHVPSARKAQEEQAGVIGNQRKRQSVDLKSS